MFRRTASDKILYDKAFNIVKHLKYDGYQRCLASMVYKFFEKETSDANTSATRERSETLRSETLTT